MLSSRIENIALSGTMEISAKTIEMQNNGIDVIDLCVGESDLPTPDHIKLAANKAIAENKTKYTTNSGIIELRTAICDKFRNEYNANYNIKEVIVSNGAKQAIYNSLQTIISNNDEVILPLPYYVSYPHMIRLAGGIPIYVKTKTENSYKLTVSELKSSLTQHTKAIVLCNPNNPSGSVYSREELQSILEVAHSNGLYIIADEIYENFIYDSKEFASTCSFDDKFKDHLIIINGVSKAYAMTGWRIGYVLAPEAIIFGINKLQSHSTSNACTISQYAALEALTGTQTVVEEQRKIFERRRNLVKDLMTDISVFNFNVPQGAFYFFINIEKILKRSDKYRNSKDFCMDLLDEAHVATVPGSVFGMEGYIRISYAKSEENLLKAMERIKNAVTVFA